jgi:hypothetical protein
MSLQVASTPAQKRLADQALENVDRLARQANGRHAIATPAKAVTVTKPKFLHSPFIPFDVQTLIAGRAGENKTTLTIAIAAKATRGQLPGDMLHHPITVAFSAFEDPKGIQVARLKAAGADLDRIRFIDMADTCDGQSIDTGMTIPADLPQIERLLESEGVGLWIIDPITSAVSGDTNKRDDVRHALDPLAAMAQRLHIPIIEVLHFNKGGGYASDKISGSHAWRDTAKSVLLMARDEASGDIVLTIDKSNYSAAVGSSWTFPVHSVDVHTDDGQTVAVPVAGELTPTDTTVGEVINRQMNPDEQDNAGGSPTEVIDWLTDYLRDGSAPFNDIWAAAKDEGYSKTQLRNAQHRASNPCVESVADPAYSGRGQRRIWRLSNSVHTTSHAQVNTNEHKSETVSAVGLTNSVQLVFNSDKDGSEHKSETQAATGGPHGRPLDLSRFDASQLDGLAHSWAKQLERDGMHSIDATLARMTPASLELLNQRGGVLKTATDLEYQRRSGVPALTA